MVEKNKLDYENLSIYQKKWTLWKQIEQEIRKRILSLEDHLQEAQLGK